MRIWQQHSLGDPMELLRLEEVDDPVVDPGKVLVEVEAVGLTFVDCLMARGMYQATTPIPWSPGTEIVGRVTEIGEGVQDLEPGQRVVGMGGGGVAEKAALRTAGSIQARRERDRGGRCGSVGELRNIVVCVA